MEPIGELGLKRLGSQGHSGDWARGKGLGRTLERLGISPPLNQEIMQEIIYQLWRRLSFAAAGLIGRSGDWIAREIPRGCGRLDFAAAGLIAIRCSDTM